MFTLSVLHSVPVGKIRFSPHWSLDFISFRHLNSFLSWLRFCPPIMTDLWAVFTCRWKILLFKSVTALLISRIFSRNHLNVCPTGAKCCMRLHKAPVGQTFSLLTPERFANKKEWCLLCFFWCDVCLSKNKTRNCHEFHVFH